MKSYFHPLKPGNSVEEKTLTIRKGAINLSDLAVSTTSSRQGKPWTKGGSDGTKEPIQNCVGRTRKQAGVTESLNEISLV